MSDEIDTSVIKPPIATLQHRFRSADFRRAWWVQILLAIGLSVLAFFIRLALDPWLGARQPHTTAYLTIALAGWVGGWGSGAFSAALSYAWGLYFFSEPRYTFSMSPDDGVAALTFAAVVAILLFLTNRASTASKELRIVVKRLQAVDQRRAALLATLAHELRSPLEAIQSASTILEARGTSAEVVSRIQRLLARQVQFMRRLTDDLTDAVRIHEGKISLHKELVGLDDLVRGTLEGLEPDLARRQQVLRLVTPATHRTVSVDPVRFNQILSNLLYNASKFSPERATITLDVTLADEWLNVKVTDAGVGIPPDRLEWVFDDFTQIREGGEGFGLGLALVRRLVELHGGSIHALSRGAGEGTSFELRIPQTAENI